MEYHTIVEGIFLERPNRFIAYVLVDGKKERVHVKNTGRCKELLPQGAIVYLSKEEGKERKTLYDLVAVKKGDRIINMDSQAPNKIVEEALREGKILGDIEEIRPEKVYGQSRFDFFVKTADKNYWIEVKGVTLEENNVCSFPDAPSERAVKHLEELIQAKRAGDEAMVIFVIQIKGVNVLLPNDTTHPAFGEVLRKAKKEGVEVKAFDCTVEKGKVTLNEEVPVLLEQKKEILFLPKAMLDWYNKGHRDLPWRNDPTGYHVWISEIMLQQTRVEAVKPYYHRFLEELPDIEDLAQVEENRLLKLWEGLGYYNRARNLKKAAGIIMEQYEGNMPAEYEELNKLPGIGSYTAGAISSIAFGKAYPAVDGNVLRILSRIMMDERDIGKEKTKKEMEHYLLQVMPKDTPGDFNQSLMELGATVCLPKGKPLCEECPCKEFCRAHGEGKEEEFPKKEKAKARTIEKKTVLLMEDDKRFLIHKRDNKGLLAGMYEFPMKEGHLTRKELLQTFEDMGINVVKAEKLEKTNHIFSHKEWQMAGYHIKLDELSCHQKIWEENEWILIEKNKVSEEYPLPSAFAFYAKYLNIPQGSSKLKRSKKK